MSRQLISIYNNKSTDIGAVPNLPIDDFRETVINSVNTGRRIAAFFGLPHDNDSLKLIIVLADDHQSILHLASTCVKEKYPSLTPDCPQAHWFEREIAEQFGIRPEGHPWLKPIRFHHSYTNNDVWNRSANETILPCVTDFFRVEGSEIHEVAVGPVHAGIIEPGHFRFQCNGENVLHLEISLGYQHRGIERQMTTAPQNRLIHYMETAAGDTTIGHTMAHCYIFEGLASCSAAARAQVLRGIALELERLANHTGDLGALAGDVGYLPTSSFCGRIRGDFLNMTAILCGNRFGRNFMRPGGTAYDIEKSHIDDLRKRLNAALKDVTNAANCLWSTPSVLGRFEDTGILNKQICSQLGIVGPPARACGFDRDCRYNFPSGIFQFKQMPVATWDSGDVFARAYVRWLEIQHSVAFILDLLDSIPAGNIQNKISAMSPCKIAVSLVEGWRGEICHVAVTDNSGKLARYKIVDPSFHNWMGLAVALRNQQISDFPLCNKSFNLSYCGHDL
ncbi:MAG: hydrogenase [Planctomycetes bacterium GWF2_41_51]|nr:MAG: hydrogenase [Planctomycetes bacterium GWF2_41_51]HBG25728.1 hydrogenase [Phycisphaerales bacterium]